MKLNVNREKIPVKIEKLLLCRDGGKGKEGSFSPSVFPRRWPMWKIVCITVKSTANEPLGVVLE